MEAVTGFSGALSDVVRPARNKRRIGIAAALVAAALALTSCAQGEHAATSTDKPAVEGAGGQIGKIKLLDVSVQAPNIAGRATGTKFYAPGDNAPLTITLVNSGHDADTLTSVTSTSFTGWSITNTATSGNPQVVSAGATSQVVPPQTRIPLGLSDLGVGIGSSDQTLVMRGLTTAGGNLYPGSQIPITFTFANAGSVTLQVPVDLTATPTTGSIPPLPGDSGD